jgi:hypothetical protein
LKKSKTPFLLRAVRWFFPRLERLSPALAGRFFIQLFFTPLNYPVPPKEQDCAATADQSAIDINGKKIICYSWGKGPIVLVVHGWAGRATQFRKFIEPLNKAGYCVVGFDGPAHGKSGGSRTDIFEFELVLRAVVARYGMPEGVIAHSFGGTAVLYAVMNGLRLKKIIHIASPTIGDEIINTYLKAIGGTWETGKRFKKFIVKKSGKTFDEFTSLHFVRHLKDEIDLLLIHDQDDEEVEIKHPLELIKAYPEAKLHRTTGLGHTRILKDEGVIAKCVTFIAGIRLSGNNSAPGEGNETN